MAKRPQKFWATLWIVEGGNPRKADLASAVVMAESDGDETSDTNPCCKGGYQINVEVGNTSRACAMNAVCATRWAIKGSNNGHDWTQWEAYTNGSYKAFLGKSGVGPSTTKKQAHNVLASFPTGPNIPGTPINPEILGEAASKALGGIGEAGIPGISQLAEALSNIAAFFRGAGELLLTPEGWLRLGKLFGGAILLLWGLRIVIRESTGVDAVKASKSTVTKAAEAASLAAIVK